MTSTNKTSTGKTRPLLSVRSTRCLAACMAFFVTAQLSALPLQQAQSQPPARQTQSQPAAQDSTSNAATQISKLPAELPQAPQPAQQETQQTGSQQPLGTAAGPSTQPIGVAGTRPSGAAIAPARQRRARAFFIKVSLIVAAVAAAGAVVALSSASPSRPQ